MSEGELTTRIGSDFRAMSPDQISGGFQDLAGGDEFRLYARTLPEHDIQVVIRDGILVKAEILSTVGTRGVVVRVGEQGTTTSHAGYVLFAVAELLGRAGVISEATAAQARAGSERQGLTFRTGSVPQVMQLLLVAVKRDAERPGHVGYRVTANASRGEMVVTSAGKGPGFPRSYHLWVIGGDGQLGLAGTSL